MAKQGSAARPHKAHCPAVGGGSTAHSTQSVGVAAGGTAKPAWCWAGLGLGDRIEPPPDIGRGEWSAVSDKDVGRVTVEDALHRRTVTAAVLGEEVPQRVTRADSPAREAASDEIADDGIAVIEQDDVGARGVAADRDYLCSHSVVV